MGRDKNREFHFDLAFMSMAGEFSNLSRAKRAKVGAVIVKDGNVLACGFNGTPSKFNNQCEDKDGNTRPEVLHAEMNCIAKMSKSTLSSLGSTIYVTMSPCLACATMMYSVGITRVVYRDEYRLKDGINFLKKMKVKVEKL